MAIICIDIGGTKINAGVMNDQMKIIEKYRYSTNRLELMSQLEDVIENVLAITQDDIQAIGISTAGRVDFATGVINYATSVLPGWTGTEVKRILERKFDRLVVVDNDGNCAALAEHRVGAGQSSKSMICITLGTGVGGGIIANNELIRGQFGAAGEVGHMLFESNGLLCSCGKKGCWEQYVSGTALQKVVANHPKFQEVNLSLERLFLIAETDEHAYSIVQNFISNVATGLSSLNDVLDPEMIVIGGGMIHSAELWWDKLLNIFAGHAELKQAELGNEAGMIGAGLLAYEALKGK